MLKKRDLRSCAKENWQGKNFLKNWNNQCQAQKIGKVGKLGNIWNKSYDFASLSLKK